MQPESNNKKIPQSRWFKQHKFISYSSEGWKIQDQGAGKFDFWWKVSSWLREDSFLLSNMHLRLLHVFSCLTAHFILVLNNVLLSDCTKRSVFSFLFFCVCFVCVCVCVFSYKDSHTIRSGPWLLFLLKYSWLMKLC